MLSSKRINKKQLREAASESDEEKKLRPKAMKIVTEVVSHKKKKPSADSSGDEAVVTPVKVKSKNCNNKSPQDVMKAILQGEGFVMPAASSFEIRSSYKASETHFLSVYVDRILICVIVSGQTFHVKDYLRSKAVGGLMLDRRCLEPICDILSRFSGELYDQTALIPYFVNVVKPESVYFLLTKNGATTYQNKSLAMVASDLKHYLSSAEYWNDGRDDKSQPGHRYSINDLDPIELSTNTSDDNQVRSAALVQFLNAHVYTARSDQGRGLERLRAQFPPRAVPGPWESESD